MRLGEAAATGLREIRAHTTRSVLSCLSISIGVAAMVYTFSTIEGMERRAKRAVALAGHGRILIHPKEGYTARGLSRGLAFQDADEIRRRWPELPMVHATVQRWGSKTAFEGFKADDITVLATTPEWAKRDWVYAMRGRFLNGEDVREAARVCVVIQPGGWIRRPPWARRLPPSGLGKALERRDWLGRRVSIEGHLFTVVGILREPPRDRDPRWFRSFGGGSGTILVPLTTYRYLLARRGRPPEAVDRIDFDTGDAATAGLYRRRVESLLRARHRGEPDFEVKDFREVMQGAINQMRKYANAILAIGIVAILAGGIGIMNVTLATVFSRVREIGIRRALGATRGDILGQFLTEAVRLGAVGGLAGSGLGAAAVTYLSPRADRMAAISPLHVAGALLLAAAAAFLFALYPAYQASRLDPVEALRHE
ncbi:MAG: ABC transporter permease [Elusimicrobia bacterium]|nr:ABC transporter permease [Elusimicrobiota bacterium]